MNGASRGGNGWRRARRTGVAMVLGLALLAGASTGAAEVPRIDLNEASVAELTSLPGIGPARAQAIVEWRSEAPFETVDDLEEVPGIGPALLERLRDRIEVKPARQVRGEARSR